MLSAGVSIIMGSTSQPSLGLQQRLCQGEGRLVPTCSAPESEGGLVSHSLLFRSLVGCRLWGRIVGHDRSDLAAAPSPAEREQKHFEHNDLQREKNFQSCQLEEALFIQWVFIVLLLKTKSAMITVSCCSERKTLIKKTVSLNVLIYEERGGRSWWNRQGWSSPPFHCVGVCVCVCTPLTSSGFGERKENMNKRSAGGCSWTSQDRAPLTEPWGAEELKVWDVSVHRGTTASPRASLCCPGLHQPSPWGPAKDSAEVHLRVTGTAQTLSTITYTSYWQWICTY